MIFQGTAAARRKDFRGQAAIVGTESGLGRCPTDRASARRWALCLRHEFESLLFALSLHKKIASQIEHWLAQSPVPVSLAWSWLADRVCATSFSLDLHR
jgi:hypothetical protein